MDHSTFKGVRVRLKPPITPFRDNFRITIRKLAEPLNTSAFLGTNPMRDR